MSLRPASSASTAPPPPTRHLAGWVTSRHTRSGTEQQGPGASRVRIGAERGGRNGGDPRHSAGPRFLHVERVMFFHTVFFAWAWRAVRETFMHDCLIFILNIIPNYQFHKSPLNRYLCRFGRPF